ncbi:imidazole glycerol phosphate synthase subunit HisH [Microbacterium sp. GXF6406]
MSVTVIDFGLGNIGSVVNMFKRIGVQPKVAQSSDEVLSAERILLPGVGAFDRGMERLDSAGLTSSVKTFAESGRPVLGICLGMQLLLDSSEEGTSAGLGLIPGRSIRFAEASGLRVPHMGWNRISATREDPILADPADDQRFYFVHSYHAVPANPAHQLASTTYGKPFTSMIRDNNVIGAQFHPEKSHKFGMTLLQRFSEL